MKKLVINTAHCDLRSVSEETLKAYEAIRINSAVVTITRSAKALIAKYPVTMNVGSVIELPEGEEVHFIIRNGKTVLSGSDMPKPNTYLLINGALSIETDGVNAAKAYASIFANGSVTMPKSAAGTLANLQINGAMQLYPDGAVRLKNTAQIDRLFALRAKNALYFAQNRLLFVDEALDTAKLTEKGVRFESKSAVILEKFAADIVPLLAEQTDVIIVPEGMAFIHGDVQLNDLLLKKHGEKLFVFGNAAIDEKSADALSRIEKLTVRGKVCVTAAMAEAFDAVNAAYEYLEIVRTYDRTVSDKIAVTVDQQILEACPGGLLVRDCVQVKLNADAKRETILSTLEVRDCATVSCTPEQESALALVCTDVGHISAGEEALHSLLPENDAKIIRAASYVL